MGCGCKKKKPVATKPANQSTTQSTNQPNNGSN
jgi:hypothetical protein